LVVFFENDDGTGEFSALAVGLVTDVSSQSDSPDFSFPKVGPRGFVRSVSGFLDAVPAIEIVPHI
jgi:hypothetical protein